MLGTSERYPALPWLTVLFLVIGLTGGIASGMSYTMRSILGNSSQLSLSYRFLRKVHRLGPAIDATQHPNHRRRLSRTRCHTTGHTRLQGNHITFW
jgi:hypothetical protein